MCACSCVCGCACMWVETRGWLLEPSSAALYPSFWDIVSQWAWSSLILERLADQPQRSSCLCLSRAGVAGLHQCVWFLMWVLGFELRSCASVRSSLLPEPSSALLVLLSNLLLFLYNPISSFHPRYFALSGVLYKRHHSCLSFSLILSSLFPWV